MALLVGTCIVIQTGIFFLRALNQLLLDSFGCLRRRFVFHSRRLHQLRRVELMQQGLVRADQPELVWKAVFDVCWESNSKTTKTQSPITAEVAYALHFYLPNDLVTKRSLHQMS